MGFENNQILLGISELYNYSILIRIFESLSFSPSALLLQNPIKRERKKVQL